MALSKLPDHPALYSIIQEEGSEFHYIYIGSYYYEDGEEDVNYMLVRAVYYYGGKYYTIPSSFSSNGIFSPTRSWKLISGPVNPKSIKDLPLSICQNECPGFLDTKRSLE